MSVNAGAEEEYEKRRKPIWPELEKVFKDYGEMLKLRPNFSD